MNIQIAQSRGKTLATILSVFSGLCFFAVLPAKAQVSTSISFTSSRSTPGVGVNLTANAGLPSISVGTVNIKSNSNNGFSVSVQSANAGQLRHISGETIIYALNYNGVDKGQISGQLSLEDYNSLVPGCIPPIGCNRDVKISIQKSEITAKPAGSYSDLLTFTIVGK